MTTRFLSRSLLPLAFAAHAVAAQAGGTGFIFSAGGSAANVGGMAFHVQTGFESLTPLVGLRVEAALVLVGSGSGVANPNCGDSHLCGGPAIATGMPAASIVNNASLVVPIFNRRHAPYLIGGVGMMFGTGLDRGGHEYGSSLSTSLGAGFPALFDGRALGVEIRQHRLRDGVGDVRSLLMLSVIYRTL